MGIFRAGPTGVFALSCALLCPCAAQIQFPLAQSPQTAPSSTDPYAAGQPPAGAQPGDHPLTPEEKRQQEIEKYNPLNPVNPAKRDLPGDPARLAPKTTDTERVNPNRDAQVAPLPGSVADSSQAVPAATKTDGPEVVTGNDDTTADTGQYNGPAVLSRSYTIARPVDAKEVKWSWNIGTSEIWQTGLLGNPAAATGTTGGTAPATTAATTANGVSFGTGTQFSIIGRHLWKKDQIGLNYNAAYNKYYSAGGYDGTNQNLALDYEHYFSRRLSVNLVETGSIFSENASLTNPLTTPGVSPANLDFAASPAIQVLDQRVRQFMTNASLTWQQSARLSFSLSEGFFAVDRSGPELFSGTGYQSQADVNYRYTRRTTIGAYYSYSDYLYTKHQSTSDSHTIGLIYSYAFNRTTQLRLRGGATRIESLGYSTVPIDPVFASLVGQAFGVVDAYSKNYISDFSGQFVKDFGRRRSASLSAARGIAPGNGLILTSVQEVYSATFSTALFRTYALSFSGGKTALSAQGPNTNTYASDYLGLTLSHTIPRGPAATFSFNYRTYSIANMPGIQKQFSISTGLSWSPGPGRLW